MNFLDMHWEAKAIALNASETDEFDTGGRGIAAILVPDGWTTAALTVRSQVEDGGTFYPVYLDDGSEMGIASANMTHSRIIFLAPDGAGVGFQHAVKLRSGTAALAVNQTTARVVWVAFRAF